MEREHKLHKLFVINARLHLPVKEIAGRLGERRFVNSINGLMKRLGIEERVLHLRGIIFETLIDRRRALAGFPS